MGATYAAAGVAHRRHHPRSRTSSAASLKRCLRSAERPQARAQPAQPIGIGTDTAIRAMDAGVLERVVARGIEHPQQRSVGLTHRRLLLKRTLAYDAQSSVTDQ